MLVVNFLEYPCIVTFGKYSNGRTAIELYIEETGEPMLTATVNLPTEPLLPNEVAIKNYSENEGILGVLISAGIISKPKRRVNSGFISVPICELLVEPK